MRTPDRRQSKTLIPSTNVAQKSLETEFSIAICKWQSRTLFLAIFDPRSSIVNSVFSAAYPVWSVRLESLTGSGSGLKRLRRRTTA